MVAMIGYASFALIGVALLLCLARLLKGPSGPDRLLAAETLSLGLVGLLVLQTGAREAGLYVDSALGLALFSFVATAVLALVLKRRELE